MRLRSELKFLVHHSVRTLLLERWDRFLVRAPFTTRHGFTPILSPYYATPRLDSYQDKLDGIGFRRQRIQQARGDLAIGFRSLISLKKHIFTYACKPFLWP